MRKRELTTEEAFDLYLHNEGIVYAVLKEYGIDWNNPDYEDLRDEGILAFISTCRATSNKDMGYLMQSVRWKVAGLLRKGNRKVNHEEEMTEKVEDGQVEAGLTPEEDLLYEEVMKVCDDDEKRLVRGLLSGDSITNLSKRLGMHRSKIYRMRDNLQFKLGSLLAA